MSLLTITIDGSKYAENCYLNQDALRIAVLDVINIHRDLEGVPLRTIAIDGYSLPNDIVKILDQVEEDSPLSDENTVKVDDALACIIRFLSEG